MANKHNDKMDKISYQHTSWKELVSTPGYAATIAFLGHGHLEKTAHRTLTTIYYRCGPSVDPSELSNCSNRALAALRILSL